MKNNLFKEERMNPLVGTEGLHFIVTQDDAGDTVLHVFNSEDEADLYHGQLRGLGGIKRIGRLKGSKRLYLGSDVIAGVTKQFGAEPRMIRHDDKENPRGVYTTYKSWLAAAKKAGAVRLDGDKDIAMAFDAKGRGVAEWDGAEGYIYKSESRENPLRPRKGESSRDFVSRCMSEEKASFPEPKQRIAVCLSKSRKRNPVYDTGCDE